jgi:hypothetical protein
MTEPNLNVNQQRGHDNQPNPTGIKRSDRCSTRVDSPTPETPESAAIRSQFAPECLAHSGRHLLAEGRPQQAANQPAPKRRGPGRNSQRRQAEQLQTKLTTRDHAVLTSLQDHHYLTTTQLQRFHFDDHQTMSAAGRICRRALTRLAELGVIEHLDRRVGGVRAGSASYVWRLGRIGEALLRLSQPQRPRSRHKEPSLHHLEHCLAIADSHLALLDLARQNVVESATVVTEPSCWRRYLAPSGAMATLKPDLYAMTTSGEFEDHWFIEVDRGTESLPTLLSKCAQYEDYRRTADAQHDNGVFPLVLWLMPSVQHAEWLGQAIARTKNLDSGLYRIGTLAELERILSEVQP